MSTNIITNPQLELAWQYISQTNRHVYLTGKAGTGKTTFLHRIRSEVLKYTAVVAPTGVAAINAGGQTIHSLFQLPFGFIGPGDTGRARRLSKKKLQLLANLDLLVIDEISMVRADVLDAIDEVLRRVRRNDRPFGGLQLLLIGDLHQLPPVVKEVDRRALLQRYRTPYFFGSHALQKANPATIELTHIYRQADERFIGLLNRVRNDDMNDEVFAALNERYRPGFNPVDAEGYITLTSHKAAARRINTGKLNKLAGQRHDYVATITGKFPPSMYPNTVELGFKVGAQVMFNKNDTVERLYYNGKIGKIIAIRKEVITVKCPDDDFIISVSPVSWDNIAYEMDTATKTVTDNVIGSFIQHPLKLAWAITIHKSQGLTFEKVIIDAADAFAHGQVYVALSRCKTFKGIVLRSRIGDSSIKTDRVISNYSEVSAKNQPTREELLIDKRAFQLDCLREIFGFGDLHNAVAGLRRALFEHDRGLQSGRPADFAPIARSIAERAVGPGRKFLPEINTWGHPDLSAEQQRKLADRLTAAGDYFTNFFKNELTFSLSSFGFLSDNQKIRIAVGEKLSELRLICLIKLRVFESFANGFDPAVCVRARTAARLEFSSPLQKVPGKPVSVSVPREVAHPDLYRKLVAWRLTEANERKIPLYNVAPNSVLADVATLLPGSPESLLTIRKLGKKTCENYGDDLLTIVSAYTLKNGLKSDKRTLNSVVRLAPDTYQISLGLFRKGQSIQEIAGTRNLKESTIMTHLALFVREGVLPVAALVAPEVVEELLPFLDSNPDAPTSYVHHSFGGKYNNGHIRTVTAHQEWLNGKDREMTA